MAGTPVKGSTPPVAGKVLMVEQCQRAITLQQFWGETVRARILVRTPFQGLGDRVENENCKVRDLEKARFGEKSEPGTLQEEISFSEGEGGGSERRWLLCQVKKRGGVHRKHTCAEMQRFEGVCFSS